MSNQKILKKLLEKITILENKLDSKVYLTYYNTIFQFINSEFLTIYLSLKLLAFYYLKKLIYFSFKETF
ncbi:MAG: hypothetical protein AM1032_000361 [Mycoplasmataceae bacterium]|nr:MAG: hypothetical protein AM1032_000361 [Mycoplasmataceae bacterium]